MRKTGVAAGREGPDRRGTHEHPTHGIYVHVALKCRYYYYYLFIRKSARPTDLIFNQNVVPTNNVRRYRVNMAKCKTRCPHRNLNTPVHVVNACHFVESVLVLVALKGNITFST